jgi:hypothetical protein
MCGALMPLLRIVPAVLSFLVAALFLSKAMKRMIGVAVFLVGGALAASAGVMLVGSLLWSFVRHLRGHDDTQI